MSTLVLILVAWAALAVLMAGLWAVQRVRHNAGIVDIAWSFGTGLAAAWFAFGADGDPARRWLVGILAMLWGGRLGVHLVSRLLSEEEDGRYRSLREQWGERTQLYLFMFFQVQATWAVIFALPMLIAASVDDPGLTILDWLGVVVWLVAIGGEAIADRQLARFKARPDSKGKVCREGLWRFSRHPNYFFEWIHWWAYVLIAVQGTWGWLALGGPIVMLLFLTKVTGIPPTERHAVRSRGEAYRAYQRTTSAFFPWPPREDPKATTTDGTEATGTS